MIYQDLKKRTKEFSRRCIKMALSLPGCFLGTHIAHQLIRSSTSVAANYRASYLAQTKRGFISKLSIVIEETDESLYWIELACEENLLREEKIENLKSEADELTRIFISSRKTAIQKLEESEKKSR